MKLTAKQKAIIREWYHYISYDSQHYGNGAVMFPGEAYLLRKLSDNNDHTDFSQSDLETFYDWMQTNIRRKYGNAVYIIGEEHTLYELLTRELGKETEQPAVQTENAEVKKQHTKEKPSAEKSSKRGKTVFLIILVLCTFLAVFLLLRKNDEEFSFKKFYAKQFKINKFQKEDTVSVKKENEVVREIQKDENIGKNAC